ncbi:MAG: biopolymer transporter ExbD [Pseudomonadota bacterium]
MRQSLESRLAAREETRIDLSPLIDVVFILLIFFIVSTVFVKETGIEVDKPNALSSQQIERNVLLIGIGADGAVVYGGTRIGVAGVRATLEPLLANRRQPVVVQADAVVPTALLVRVIDQAKLAGAEAVHVATVAEDGQ